MPPFPQFSVTILPKEPLTQKSKFKQNSQESNICTDESNSNTHSEHLNILWVQIQQLKFQASNICSQTNFRLRMICIYFPQHFLNRFDSYSTFVSIP